MCEDLRLFLCKRDNNKHFDFQTFCYGGVL